jgi:hypothetical protein
VVPCIISQFEILEAIRDGGMGVVNLIVSDTALAPVILVANWDAELKTR